MNEKNFALLLNLLTFMVPCLLSKENATLGQKLCLNNKFEIGITYDMHGNVKIFEGGFTDILIPIASAENEVFCHTHPASAGNIAPPSGNDIKYGSFAFSDRRINIVFNVAGTWSFTESDALINHFETLKRKSKTKVGDLLNLMSNNAQVYASQLLLKKIDISEYVDRMRFLVNKDHDMGVIMQWHPVHSAEAIDNIFTKLNYTNAQSFFHHCILNA